jgi:hypothetical protein
MPIYNWSGQAERPLMPAAGQTVNGEAFAVPNNAKAIQIHIPDLVGAATTLKLQALAPTEDVESSQTWRDVTVFDLTDGSFEALDGFPENTIVVVPTSATGAGNFRFVASADQSSVPAKIIIFWSYD